MAKLVQITFRNPNGASEAAQKAAWERAHQIAEWPGLQWKIWIAEPSQLLYGGIYLFEDENSAIAYLKSPIVDSIQALPGVSDFAAHLFDINSPLTAVTRGPLTTDSTDIETVQR
jgi:hypothetical protein